VKTEIYFPRRKDTTAETAIYQKRWKVEEFFRSIKTNAAFAKVPTKTVKTEQAHFTAQ